MRVRARVGVDRRFASFGERAEAAAVCFGLSRAPKAHLAGSRAADREPVPVEDERFSRAKLLLRPIGQPGPGLPCQSAFLVPFWLQMTPETIVIPRRFNGPPDSANGGYAAGVVAALLGGDAEVTLRSPPPLDSPLAVALDDGRVEVRNGETLVAVGEPMGELELDIPAPVSVDDAEAARKNYAGFRHHAYSTCFTCGPDRADGLGIFAGPVSGRDLVAAPWLPAPGEVAPEVVWAALDCPSGWAVDEFQREGVLLGRLAARIVEPVVGTGEPYVVVGWGTGADGRKRYAGSAVFTAGGELCACARSTWIVPA